MKNINVLPTEKPSRIYKSEGTGELEILSSYSINVDGNGKNLYITSDEEIKEGDWVIVTNIANGLIFVKQHKGIAKALSSPRKKIILTTDQDLIKDGVQSIDDEFLEWFIAKANDSGNPIDIVEVKPMLSNNGRALYGYKIIIPKEEPKQKTLEEVAERLNPYVLNGRTPFKEGFIACAKWQQERSYSEEDMLKSYHCGRLYVGREGDITFQEFLKKLNK